jgi:plasmid stability protein
MKTTLDLPDSLVRQMKLRAVRDGRKLKDVAADLLRRGLAAPEVARKPIIRTDPKTGLPIITGGRPARPGEELTPERIADILMTEEIERADAFGGR